MSAVNKEVGRRAWAAYASGDVAGFTACLTEDWMEHDPDGNSSGVADNVEAMRRQRDAVPDTRAEILLDVADADLVAQYVVTTATHRGRYFDLEPTGKQLRVVEMIFHRMRDGRIAESWAITDGPGFYEQLTGRPAPESRENMA